MIEQMTKERLHSFVGSGQKRQGSKAASALQKKILAASPQQLALLQNCASYYDNLSSVRTERIRNLRYRNGDQWSDYVEDPDQKGAMVREDEVISRGGKIPLKYNFISQYVRNLTGQLLASPSQSVVYARGRENDSVSLMLTNALGASHTLNGIAKLDIAILEELLLAGIGCVKVRYDLIPAKNRYDATVSMVNINRLFFNGDIEDPRMSDIRVIGELHDYTWDDLVFNFASSKADEQQLAKIYGVSGGVSRYVDDVTHLHGLSGDELRQLSFYVSSESGKFRVIEVWQRKGRWVNSIHDWADGTQQISQLSKSQVQQMNDQRIAMAAEEGIAADDVPLIELHRHYDYYWHVSHLAPTGQLLAQTENPFNHESHPYTMALMPMTDGQLRSSISDLIDIQRYINRLIVMIDFIMGTSAKGVLMIPESSIPDGYTVEDFADEYVKTNGVIVYRPTSQNVAPHQITSSSSTVGAQAMLSLQMDLMRQISGMSGAMQGLQPPSGTPSSLYAQQTENGMLNHKVLFEAMRDYRCHRDEKLLSVITQFYREPRYVSIGSDKLSTMLYEPDKVRQMVDYGVVVAQSFDTPVYRQAFDDLLMSMLNNGYITSEIFLRNCSLPFADKLLLELEQTKEAAPPQS